MVATSLITGLCIEAILKELPFLLYLLVQTKTTNKQFNSYFLCCRNFNVLACGLYADIRLISIKIQPMELIPILTTLLRL